MAPAAPPRPSGAGRDTILVLTYHEITEDARILKEARVARDAGWNVHILSAWPEGKPQSETLEGMRVTRFACYAFDELDPAIWAEFPFLDRSRFRLEATVLKLLRDQSALAERLRAQRGGDADGRGLAQVRDDLKAMDADLKRRRDDPADPRSPKYYKTHGGLRRIARKIRHIHARRRDRRQVAVAGGQDEGRAALRDLEQTLARESAERKTLRQELSRVLADRKHLYQGMALIYAANAARLTLPEGIAGVHAHDIYTLPFGVLMSRRLGVPLIYDAHEYEPARATRMASAEDTLPRDLEDDCFAHVDRIVTVGRSIADLYAARFHGPPPTLVMNVPDLPALPASGLADGAADSPDAPCVRRAAGLAPERPLLVYTGGVQYENRGLDKVMAALRLLPEFHFVCLGPRVPRQDDWLRGHVEAQGVADRVTLLPPVAAAEVPRAIRSADVAICPIQDVSISYRYAMPNKLFEAACAGVPICVSDLPDMRAFVERHGVGRTMDQTDPQAIAEAVRDAARNRDRYRQSPDDAAAFLHSYGWARQAERLAALYGEVFGEAMPRAGHA